MMKTCGEERITCERATHGLPVCVAICGRRVDGRYKAVNQDRPGWIFAKGAHPALDGAGFSTWQHRDKYNIVTLKNCMVDGILYESTVYMLMEHDREGDGITYWRSIDGVKPFASVGLAVQHANYLEAEKARANPEQTQKEPMDNPEETQSVISALKAQVHGLHSDINHLTERLELSEDRARSLMKQRDDMISSTLMVEGLRRNLSDARAEIAKMQLELTQKARTR